MAFKRESDSHEWLTLLKKRRIAELFAEDIPDDEAVLMKNGRFCCTVCYHRPIFDTAQMLAHHRTGRKHSEAQEKHLDKKREIEQLIQKRRHDQHIQGKVSTTGATSSSVSHGAHHPLLTAQKYEPTVKKKVKPGQRRLVVELEGAQTISEYKRIKSQPISENMTVKPYRSKNTSVPQMKYSTNTFDASRSDHRLDSASIPKEVKPVPSASQSTSCDKSVIFVHPKNNRTKVKPKPKMSKMTQNATDVQKRKTAELYLQARGAGWKKALDGSWIRDEDAEFDSDEEPPDIP